MSDATYIGLALILIGAVLLIMEFVHPGAFVVIPGTIILFAGILFVLFGNFNFLFSLGGPFIIVAIIIFAGVLAILFYTRLAPTHPPVASTFDTLTNFTGVVVTAVEPGTMKGKVRVRGEVWSARSEVAIPVGTNVRITGGEGVTIRVEPASAPSAAAGSS
jgi:membrane-bound ClpP family serine protease